MHAAADAFHIDGGATPRPVVDRVILADGADAASPRGADDIELSHWVPNATDARYKADTSTEICLRYVSDGSHPTADLVVNDHIDIDGILSLFVLLHPDLALEHRDTLVGAAEMGDFLAWSVRPGYTLAQETWRGATSPGAGRLEPNERCAFAFGVVTDVLTGVADEHPATTAGWAHLQSGLDLLASGEVTTTLASERLVSFVFPPTIAPAAAHGVPVLNQLVDESIALWPQARNRDHGERLQLLSSPAGSDGWFHDLWAPAYCWAETPDRWSLPGLESTGDSNRWQVADEALRAAVERLGREERGRGSWVLAAELTPFESIAGRGFPVLVSCLDDAGRLTASSLAPDDVLDALAPVWPGSSGT